MNTPVTKENTCPKCGRSYPDIFQACPYCGAKPKKRGPWKLILAVVAVVVVGLLVWQLSILAIKSSNYQLGQQLMKKGSFAEARTAFLEAGDYQDAPALAAEAGKAEHYRLGQEAFDREDYTAAIPEFEAAGDYQDAAARVQECRKGQHFLLGMEAYDSGDPDTAIAEFTAAGDWPTAADRAAAAQRMKSYQDGLALMDRGDYAAAIVEFQAAGVYTGASERIRECRYALGTAAMEAGRYQEAVDLLKKVGSYADAQQLGGECALHLGKELLSQSRFDEARAHFENAKGYADALEPQLDSYILLCKAEAALAAGELSEGVDHFNQLPQSFRPAEYDLTTRRNSISRLTPFAKLEGEFNSTQYTIQIVGEGYIHSYRQGSADDQSITIDCTMNPDGTLNISGTAFFYCFRSLPLYGMGFKASETVTFEIKNVQWVPSVHVIDEHTKIYFSNGVAKIVYSNSVEGKYPTSSTVTYNEKK